MRRLLMVGFCIMTLFNTMVFAQDLQPPFVTDSNQAVISMWTADDIVTSEQASGMQISPDNRWIVWVKSVGDKDKDKSISNLILSSLTEKKEIQLTRGADNSSSLKWSPDGEYIVFKTGRTAN